MWIYYLLLIKIGLDLPIEILFIKTENTYILFWY